MDDHLQDDDALSLTAIRGRLRGEPELHVAVARWLRAQGIRLTERVVCVAGEPDLVAADRTMIVEIKIALTRRALFQALGQLLLYRQAINPTARALIVGYCTPEALGLIPLVRQLGVEVRCWRDEEIGSASEHTQGRDTPTQVPDDRQENDTSLDGADEEIGSEAPDPLTGAEPAYDTTLDAEIDTLAYQPRGDTDEPPIPALPDDTPPFNVEHPDEARTASSDTHERRQRGLQADLPRHRVLTWRVADAARRRGIPNASQLAKVMGSNRQGLYPIWNNTAGQVTLEILARIARTLEIPPGDWFVWGSGAKDSDNTNPNPDYQSLSSRPSLLCWNVAAQAKARGLDAMRLSFQSRVHMSSIRPIWHGEQQAVAPVTLGRIALALDHPDQLFSIGALFTWEDLEKF